MKQVSAFFHTICAIRYFSLVQDSVYCKYEYVLSSGDLTVGTHLAPEEVRYIAIPISTVYKHRHGIKGAHLPIPWRPLDCRKITLIT